MFGENQMCLFKLKTKNDYWAWKYCVSKSNMFVWTLKTSFQAFEGSPIRELPHGDDRARVAVRQVARRIQEHARLRRQGKEHLQQGKRAYRWRRQILDTIFYDLELALVYQ